MKYELVIKLPCERDFSLTLNLDMKPSEVLEMMFAWFNRGSGQECVQFLESRCRSLSVNDFVKMNGQWYQCVDCGWTEVSEQFVDDMETKVRSLIRNKQSQSPWHALHYISRL